MYSESGDYIGGGLQRVYDSARGDLVAASGTAGSLSVSVSGGDYGDGFGFSLAAPDGQPFQPGAYTRAQRTPFREAGRPGIDIGGDGRGCNEDAGNFEVRDYALDGNGELLRAWVIYTQYCDGGPALFGEIRVGMPPATTTPQLVRWPESDVGRGGQTVPIFTAAPAGATITGPAAQDFVIRAADSGQVWVRFVPTAPGVRQAWLHLADADVPLQGFAYGGTTGLDMVSDPGDYAGHGATYHYGPDSSIGAYGSRSRVSAAVDGANGDWWYLDFVPAAGDILAPGTYTGATRYPFNGTGPGLSVSGNGAGCNQLDGSFTVGEITFSGGALRTLSISFEQHCEHSANALRGTLELRAGDTTAPPPWLVAGTPPQDPGTPPPGDGAAAPVAAAVAAPAATTVVSPALRPDGDTRLRELIAVEGRRHAASAKAFARAVRSLGSKARVRAATQRLLADATRYRAALAAVRPASEKPALQRRALLAALARERTSLRAFRTALADAHGSALRRARSHAVKAVASVR
jgi:hypothetical protein